MANTLLYFANSHFYTMLSVPHLLAGTIMFLSPMSYNNNYLRTYRRKNHLTQKDLAFLLSESDSSIVSRYEWGSRKPTVEFLLLYQILFDVPLSTLFPIHSGEIQELLIKRMEALITHLSTDCSGHRTSVRIEFLKSRIQALSASQNL